ncbi:MAG: hypothetical protein A2W22_06855 [Candidatus Levybacteria bacterium RBG_16_35_11]|nr:MAG: hypothetical protein A2W22_06855 [Candidatus Levybacteria bacterium RBG_16_35_11]
MKFSIFNFQFSNKKGFTLIELLIVIVIIGILATFLMVNFVGVRQRARDAQRKADLRQIQSALELYRSDQGSYPNTLPSCDEKFCSTPDCGATDNTYMQKIPCDPLSTTVDRISYTYTGGTVYSIVSCLENQNDTQKDPTPDPGCPSGRYSFTLQNP